ncbi:MAG TPA: HAD-IIIA family hydrolase [Actinomycetota bacterium]|nr:HAD-IIIA family hydrolase [Actinomycetota bacterium]
MSRRFALLDRDGTIIQERHHLDDPEQVELIPGAAAAIARLRALGLGVAVVTNQAQIGRGLLTPERLSAIHERVRSLLAVEGATLDGLYVCPHVPEDGCDCRKPAPGLALRAAAELGFDPARAFVIGDHAGDMGLGRAIGATTLFVLTGHGAQELSSARRDADHVAPDLPAAVDIIAGLVGDGAEEVARGS